MPIGCLGVLENCRIELLVPLLNSPLGREWYEVFDPHTLDAFGRREDNADIRVVVEEHLTVSAARTELPAHHSAATQAPR